MNTLRVIAIALLILPLGAVMLAAGTVAHVLTLAIWPFAYIRNAGSQFLEALLRELDSRL